jgi:hypothetical protein
MKKTILVIALLALVSMMIAPVMAQTLTGTLGGGFVNVTTYNLSVATRPYVPFVSPLGISNPEYSVDTVALIRFDTDGDRATYASGSTVAGNQTEFVAYNGSNFATAGIVATGMIGFQRLWDTAWPVPNEINGYQYLTFDYWDMANVTGGLYLDYSYLELANPGSASYDAPPPGKMGFYGTSGGHSGFGSGIYYQNVDSSMYAEYSATKPGGLGITGTISKLSGGTTYPSKAWIFNGTSGEVLTNQYTVMTSNLVFNVPAQTIKIGIQDAGLNWYNSSVLFTPTVPTVTPTPTTTIPAGYVRNNLYVWDQNDAQIVGADVDVLDVEAATWTNTTADADGWITIDTLPYHTVNVYAHYPTANIYLPNEILGLETGYYGGHNWVLVLYPYTTTPAGFVTLYINTRNYDSKAVLTGVNLQIKNLVTGATTGESTGLTDSVTTVVTNATNYQITGSKSGYLSKTININSGEGPSKTVVLELSKATVTTAPTSTIPPGGVTPVVTVDPSDPSLHGGDTSMKAQEMMNWLAMNGMMLVQLCFLITIFALLGVKLGK